MLKYSHECGNKLHSIQLGVFRVFSVKLSDLGAIRGRFTERVFGLVLAVLFKTKPKTLFRWLRIA